MNTKLEQDIRAQLFALQDLKYRDFHAKLVPTVEKDCYIGVRTPVLRKFAKVFSKQPEAMEFLETLPHKYIEENNLHAFLIETFKDFDTALIYTEKFLPYIDNWATCDLFSPKLFKKHPNEVYEKIKLWLKSSHTYTVRYGIVSLLSNYLDSEFRPEMLDLVADIRSEEYYINMAIAWYFSIALIKQYDHALPYLKNKRLDKWVHNKAIQKAVESYRIPSETKQYLKSLKEK